MRRFSGNLSSNSITVIHFKPDIPSHISEIISHLPPDIKKGIKEALKALAEDHGLGEPLVRDLKGLWKYKVRRYRIIYAPDRSNRSLRIYAVGHRKEIYEKVSLT